MVSRCSVGVCGLMIVASGVSLICSVLGSIPLASRVVVIRLMFSDWVGSVVSEVVLSPCLLLFWFGSG